MKQAYFCILLLASICVNAQNSATISINNIISTVFSDGQLFHLNDSITGFEEAPVGSGNSINFKGRLWITGYNEANQYISGAITYRPGPLDTLTGLPDTTNNNYDKVWRVNRSMIDYFQQVYQTNPELIPNDILTWPAHGENGQAQQLAPFVDLNNNGIYEAYLGCNPPQNSDYLKIEKVLLLNSENYEKIKTQRNSDSACTKGV